MVWDTLLQITHIYIYIYIWLCIWLWIYIYIYIYTSMKYPPYRLFVVKLFLDFGFFRTLDFFRLRIFWTSDFFWLRIFSDFGKFLTSEKIGFQKKLDFGKIWTSYFFGLRIFSKFVFFRTWENFGPRKNSEWGGGLGMGGVVGVVVCKEDGRGWGWVSWYCSGQ